MNQRHQWSKRFSVRRRLLTLLTSLLPAPTGWGASERVLSERLWMVTLSPSLFPEENPFALENASQADIDVMP